MVICAEDLIDHCQALGDEVEVRAEPAATTAAAIADGTLRRRRRRVDHHDGVARGRRQPHA